MPRPARRGGEVGDVRRHRHAGALGKRRLHLEEADHAALLEHARGIARGRAADRAHAELLRDPGIDLAVVVARDEDADVEVEDAGEGQHEMLAVPHGEDDRGEVDVLAVGIRRIEGEAAGQVDEAEIVRDEAAAAPWTARCAAIARCDEARLERRRRRPASLAPARASAWRPRGLRSGAGAVDWLVHALLF